MSIADLLKLSLTLQSVSDSPRLDVEVLLCHVLDKPRSYLYTWPETLLSDEQEVMFEGLLQGRQRGEPIAHLVGSKEFWSLGLEVNAHTLIPRPETELLVETALELINKSDARVLDLGTGTGAIALALASERSGWEILAVDVVPEAVQLAEKNRRHLGFDNVSIRQSDWFEKISDQVFDLILANPPYIDQEDTHLQRGDVRFEPHTALVAHNQGFADLERIITDAQHYLAEGAWLMLEHGNQQAIQIRSLLSATDFVEVKTRTDLQGHERLSYGRRSTLG